MLRYLFILFAIPFVAFGQDELEQTHVAAQFDTQLSRAERLGLLEKYGLSDVSDISEFHYKPYVIIANDAVDVDALLLNPSVEFISLVHTNAKHEFVTYLPNFFVHLRQASDLELLEREAAKLGVEVVGPNRYMENIIELRTTKNGVNPIEAVNALKATGLFRTVSPNLMHTVSDCSVNDPRYDRQWNLKNDGTPTQGNGTPGADIDAEAAWAVTTGSSNVHIVVVDSGVDTLHPDLEGKLLPGFDAMGDSTNGYPTPNYDEDGHGTCCSGIAAANTNNGIGIAGICQECMVYPVRVFHYETILGQVQPWSETQFFLDAMGWQTQADITVSSNSWGVPDQLLAFYPGSDTLINAVIDEVVDNGRGGLGVPMLFSSGNDGVTDTIPIWPARYGKTIAVGATSMCDEHKTPTSCDGENWWAGNWGEGLDVSAPGVRVATIDMMGTNGFSVSEYFNTFNGTSAACPNAAGVMALMLSETPTLPEWLARKALGLTAERVGDYWYGYWKEAGSWSMELGYGRVNAYQAVTYGASGIADADNETHTIVETHADRHVLRFEKNTYRTWSLIDMSGRIVANGNSNSSIVISHAGLPTGVYAVRVDAGGAVQTVKVVVN
ncbi:MAG: S8 family serine peptidase [Flavobacteriales bacterium]|nr:S8 family serine peptidase [Flavobacteriales bacterium]